MEEKMKKHENLRSLQLKKKTFTAKKKTDNKQDSFTKRKRLKYEEEKRLRKIRIKTI